MNTKTLNIIGLLFFATAIVWFFYSNRRLSAVFAAIAAVFFSIAARKSK